MGEFECVVENVSLMFLCTFLDTYFVAIVARGLVKCYFESAKKGCKAMVDRRLVCLQARNELLAYLPLTVASTFSYTNFNTWTRRKDSRDSCLEIAWHSTSAAWVPSRKPLAGLICKQRPCHPRVSALFHQEPPHYVSSPDVFFPSGWPHFTQQGSRRLRQVLNRIHGPPSVHTLLLPYRFQKLCT